MEKHKQAKVASPKKPLGYRPQVVEHNNLVSLYKKIKFSMELCSDPKRKYHLYVRAMELRTRINKISESLAEQSRKTTDTF